MNLSTLSLAILSLLGAILFCTFPVSGHGRLWDPPARGTMWRKGFSTPVNYNDNELNCGGFNHQVNQGYRCGICGDPYDRERVHEAGGRFATGEISKEYRQGQDEVFQVDLTANHKGFFEFRICPTNSPTIKATKECLDRNLLVLDNNGGTRHYIDFEGAAMVNVTVRLPADLTCDFCVVQWRYHAGNSWGRNPDGRDCLGCGNQEEFYGCADVRILPNSGSTGGGETTSSPRLSTSTTTTSTTTTPTTTTTSAVVTSPTTFGQSTGESVTSTTTTTTTTTDNGNGGGSTDSPVCRSHSDQADLNQWCATNCAADNCPGQICTCNDDERLECEGIGAFSNNKAMSHWCLLNCGQGYCPAHLCSCSLVPV